VPHSVSGRTFLLPILSHVILERLTTSGGEPVRAPPLQALLEGCACLWPHCLSHSRLPKRHHEKERAVTHHRLGELFWWKEEPLCRLLLLLSRCCSSSSYLITSFQLLSAPITCWAWAGLGVAQLFCTA